MLCFAQMYQLYEVFLKVALLLYAKTQLLCAVTLIESALRLLSPGVTLIESGRYAY